MKKRTIRTIIRFAIFICVIVNLILLVVYPPKNMERYCPTTNGSWYTVHHNLGDEPNHETIQCSRLFDDAPNKPTYPKWCRRREALSETDYQTLAENCDAFRNFRGYNRHTVTEEERSFPIAFSILMHEQVEQMERLLRSVYRPQNFYCVHVDSKSPQSTHDAVHAIVDCLPENVFVASASVQVHWAEFSVLEAELTCLRDLWARSDRWKYYMNLGGREFPLRTNWELVQILKAYDGGNEVDGSLNRRPREWTEYSWRKEYWRTSTKKSPPPHGFHVAKGSTHVAITRAFVDFALHDPRAQDLLDWMRDVRCPDEHFFPTLNNNPQLDVPGAYTGNPDLRDGFYVRFKLWESPEEKCHGKWVRFICTLGGGDLVRLTGSKHMFVNKLDLDMDPLAFQCLEERYFQRVAKINNADFDLEFYKSRKLVKQHV